MERIRRDPELIVRTYELEASFLATITGLAGERRASFYQPGCAINQAEEFGHEPPVLFLRVNSLWLSYVIGPFRETSYKPGLLRRCAFGRQSKSSTAL